MINVNTGFMQMAEHKKHSKVLLRIRYIQSYLFLRIVILDSHGGYVESGTVYIIVETDGVCQNGDFRFDLDK